MKNTNTENSKHFTIYHLVCERKSLNKCYNLFIGFGNFSLHPCEFSCSSALQTLCTEPRTGNTHSTCYHELGQRIVIHHHNDTRGIRLMYAAWMFSFFQLGVFSQSETETERSAAATKSKHQMKHGSSLNVIISGSFVIVHLFSCKYKPVQNRNTSSFISISCNGPPYY